MTDARIWQLARPALKIQDGTIHQLAETLGIRDYGDLLLWPDELCYVRLASDVYAQAQFVDYVAWHTFPKHWVEASVRWIGQDEIVTGLDVGRQLFSRDPRV